MTEVTSDMVTVWNDRLVRWHERDFDISSSIGLLTEVRQIMQRWVKPQTSWYASKKPQANTGHSD